MKQNLMAGVLVQLMLSGCGTAFNSASCLNSTRVLSPKLVETADFQRHADAMGEVTPGVVISCVCYDKPRKPNCNASPIQIDFGEEQRWDCPTGWVATCRQDRTIAEGMTVFGANAYDAFGGTPRDRFLVGPFGGLLGPNGEGVPPGPNEPERVRVGPTFEFRFPESQP